MNEEMIQQLANRAVVVAVTHDETRIWLLNDESLHPLLRIERAEPEHVHVRQAQAHHGHASEIGELNYFDEITRVLTDASALVLMGHGTGKANAAIRFEQHISRHSKPLLAKLAVTGTINIPALGDADIIHEARRQWKAAVEMS